MQPKMILLRALPEIAFHCIVIGIALTLVSIVACDARIRYRSEKEPMQVVLPPSDVPRVDYDLVGDSAIGGVWRLKVPGGWVVSTPGAGSCFVPDRNHTWQLEVTK